MDQDVVTALEKDGFKIAPEEFSFIIPIRVDEQTNEPKALDVEVPVQSGEHATLLSLKTIPQLFAGNRQPPSFKGEPPEEYFPFLFLLERTAVDYCNISGRIPYDEEFDRLYRQLRRRPDGVEANPLFSYLQAAARLYMSLRDVSRAEFEAVVQKLSRSAGHWAEGAASKNYHRHLHELMG